MLKVCLDFEVSQPQYTYRRYAYKKGADVISFILFFPIFYACFIKE